MDCYSNVLSGEVVFCSLSVSGVLRLVRNIILKKNNSLPFLYFQPHIVNLHMPRPDPTTEAITPSFTFIGRWSWFEEIQAVMIVVCVIPNHALLRVPRSPASGQQI